MRLTACDCDEWHRKILAAFIRRQTLRMMNPTSELTMRMPNKHWLGSEKPSDNAILSQTRSEYSIIVQLLKLELERQSESFSEKIINIYWNDRQKVQCFCNAREKWVRPWNVLKKIISLLVYIDTRHHMCSITQKDVGRECASLLFVRRTKKEIFAPEIISLPCDREPDGYT